MTSVFDVYRELSRKSETREARGSRQSIRIAVNEGTPIIKKTKNFMTNDRNKTELFGLMANSIVSIESEKLIVATAGPNVKSKDVLVVVAVKMQVSHALSAASVEGIVVKCEPVNLYQPRK